MSNMNSIFNAAELAFAAYADLVKDDTSTQTAKLQAAKMTATQAEKFALRYEEVLTQFHDTGTGFSATMAPWQK